MTNPEQDNVDFCAAKTMQWLGTLPLPEARRYLSGFLLLTPPDSAAIAQLRKLFDQLSVVESQRQGIATGQLALNLDAE